MKHLLIHTFLFLFINNLNGQKSNQFSLALNYGINGNFFIQNYIEHSPPNIKQFLNKNFIGTIGGFEVTYNINSKSSLNIAWSKSLNKRIINYDGSTNIGIKDFSISHTNVFYELGYEHAVLKKKLNLRCNTGVFYLRSKQQEIIVSPTIALFEERNYKNAKMEEGGVFFGISYFKKIDTKFNFGLSSKVYYTISTSSLECITLTPTLTYNF